MKVNSINVQRRLKFGEALTTNQRKGAYKNTVNNAKEILGIQDGIHLAKIDVCAFPSTPQEDTGIGKMTSPIAKQSTDKLLSYMACNALKIFPAGPIGRQRRGYFGAYNRGAMSLGEDKINLWDLTSDKYGSILDKKDIEPFVKSNYSPDYLINYENEIGTSDMDEPNVAKGALPDYFYTINSTRDKKEILNAYKADETRQKGPLYIAWQNFKNLDETSPIKKEYDEFYSKKSPIDYDDMYTRLALAPFLKASGVPFLSENKDDIKGKDIWGDGYHFFEKFDVNPDSLSQSDRQKYYLKKEKYEVMKEEYKDEIDYYKFRQFIAHKQLHEYKDYVNNDLGAKLFGDCLVGFSHWEQQVYPDAFMKGAGGRMGLPVLNYFEIQNPNSPAYKLLEQKTKYFLDNYDGVRFDVGWSYINAVYQIDGQDKFMWLGNSLTDNIAKWAREVKGNDYDTRNLIYEFDNAGELSPFRYENRGYGEGTPTEAVDALKNLQGMAIFTTEFEHNDVNRNGAGWINKHFLDNVVHLDPDKYILGTNNHDGTPLWILASAADPKYNDRRGKNIGALMRVNNNYNYHNFNTPEKFAKAKAAEAFSCKNHFAFYMDPLGKKNRVDSHFDQDGWGENDWGLEDYRKRLTLNDEKEYHKALQEGRAYEAAELLARAIEQKDSELNGDFLKDENNKKVYNDLRAFMTYIQSRGALSEDEANEKYNNMEDIPAQFKRDYTYDRIIK